MNQNMSVLLVILSLVWLEIPTVHSQFMISPIIRRKQAVDNFMKEIAELDLPILSQNEISGKKNRDYHSIKLAGNSLQGRMVNEGNDREYSDVDLNCDLDLLDNLQVDLRRGQFSTRIECLNRGRHSTYKNQINNNDNQNHIYKIQAKFEKLIDYLNSLRASQGRKSGLTKNEKLVVEVK